MRDRACRCGVIDLHRDREIAVPRGPANGYLIGHCCREQQCLAHSPCMLDDLPDGLRQKAPVEHPGPPRPGRGLLHLKVYRSLIDMIEQAAGAGYDDLDTPGAAVSVSAGLCLLPP